MSEDLVGVLLYLAILAAIVVGGLRRTKRTEVPVWAERYGLSPSEASAELIERYLSWTRRWRMAGTLLGVGAFAKWILFDHVDDPQPGPVPWLALAAAGYLLGAIAAEITLNGIHRPERPLFPVAALEERRPEMYVGKSAMRVLWALTALSAGLVPAYFMLADQPHIRSRFGVVVAVALSVLALTLGIGRLIRHVVLRPQPAASDESRLADNAMRSSSLHAIAGSAVALGLILLSAATSELQEALEAQAPHSRVDLISVVTVGSLTLALLSWYLLGRPRPRRIHTISAVQS